MINIFAQTFMTASRSGCVELHDIPSAKEGKRLRWLSGPKKRCLDLTKL